MALTQHQLFIRGWV